MHYTVTELIWLFMTYAFLGWVIETIVGTLKKKKFVNRGFFSGPFCFVYGFAAVLMSVTLQELRDNKLFFLFLFCSIQATAVEWVTGKLLERMNQHKWWDYSEKKWNFDGYICVQYSILWGILGVLGLKFGNSLFLGVFHLIPAVAGRIAIAALLVIAAIDFTASMAAVFHLQKEIPAVCRWNRRIGIVTYRFGKWIVSHVEKRMVRAYPVIREKTHSPSKEGKFAEGCSFFKLFWLYFIGALLGDLVETVFCRITMGWWMSRSSLVWGPFSIVWGFALALATALLYKDREKKAWRIFLMGTLLGAAYEYICSVCAEIVFGKIFWDYSHIPLNLGGRVNLLFSFFWGFAAVVWIKLLYPRISNLIEKIPKRPGRIITWILIVFMAVDMLMSAAALIRYDRRDKGIPAANAVEEFLDEHFDDARMKQIYPKAKEPPE